MLGPGPIILADPSIEEAVPIFMICGVLIIALVGSMLLATWMRRRLKANDTDSTGSGGFTLGQLRQLHKTGQMTAEEYERARLALLASMGKLPAGGTGLSSARPNRGMDLPPPGK